MYLFSAAGKYDGDTSASSVSQYHQTVPQQSSYMNKLIGKELLTVALSRQKFKDATSSKLQVKGPQQAESVQKAEMFVLRNQLKSLDVALLEDTRKFYNLQQNIRRKDLQDFQCVMIGKLEAILWEKITASGLDYRKYQIGGTDSGTYERFFRIEPGKYMTKAQLITALRRSFGNEVLASEAQINKLFDSFDFGRTDEMDWRAFLYLLTIMMQPSLPYDEHIRWAYAIYSSCGSLDLSCTEPLSIGQFKDMICCPILLSQRGEIRSAIDAAWLDLSMRDKYCIQYVTKQSSAKKVSQSNDPDDFKINFSIFQKIATETQFSEFLKTCNSYGKKDLRRWTSVLEENFFHPAILKQIKKLRRETRDNEEADKFIAQQDVRTRSASFSLWKKYILRRNMLRGAMIACEIRAQLGTFAICFDHWRKCTMEERGAQDLQRCVRGFVGRRRKWFIRKLNQKVVQIQSGTRQVFVRMKYRRKRMKVHFAATQIQRTFRGYQARIRVQTMVESLYDTGKRQLERDRAQWMLARHNKAASALQNVFRRLVRRNKTLRKLDLSRKIDQVQQLVLDTVEKGRVERELYQQELSKWYQERKADYDRTVLNDKQTALQKKMILERRRKRQDEEKKQKQLERELQLQKIAEEQQVIWQKRWEEKIEERGIQRRKNCQNCLLLPETPEDLILQKDLKKRIKKQIKDVLRRADKQKIPMEIPEATEIAKKEVIEEEVVFELERGKKAMEEDAAQLAREEVERKEKAAELKAQERRRKKMYSLLCIQQTIKAFLARKRLRQKAYKRYRKLFDPVSLNYYYEDRRTKKTFWEKPSSLGSYDIEIPDKGWIIVRDPQNNLYYYNPSTWLMSWKQPLGTKLCEVCKEEFAVAKLYLDGLCYGETCLSGKANELLTEQLYNPLDIVFQEVDGNHEDAQFVQFEFVAFTNWYEHCLAMDPAFKLSEEEEDELAAQQEMERLKQEEELKKAEGMAKSWQGKIKKKRRKKKMLKLMKEQERKEREASGNGLGSDSHDESLEESSMEESLDGTEKEGGRLVDTTRQGEKFAKAVMASMGQMRRHHQEAVVRMHCHVCASHSKVTDAEVRCLDCGTNHEPIESQSAIGGEGSASSSSLIETDSVSTSYFCMECYEKSHQQLNHNYSPLNPSEPVVGDVDPKPVPLVRTSSGLTVPRDQLAVFLPVDLQSHPDDASEEVLQQPRHETSPSEPVLKIFRNPRIHRVEYLEMIPEEIIGDERRSDRVSNRVENDYSVGKQRESESEFSSSNSNEKKTKKLSKKKKKKVLKQMNDAETGMDEKVNLKKKIKKKKKSPSNTMIDPLLEVKPSVLPAIPIPNGHTADSSNSSSHHGDEGEKVLNKSLSFPKIAGVNHRNQINSYFRPPSEHRSDFEAVDMQRSGDVLIPEEVRSVVL